MREVVRRQSRRPRGARWMLAAAVLASAGVTPAAARAQRAAPAAAAAPISLDNIVAIAVAHSPGLLLAIRQLDAARGALLLAAAPFDAQVQTSVGQVRSGEPTLATADGAPLSPLVTNQTSSTVAMSKTLRSGVQVSPQLGVTRTDVSLLPGVATSRATASLTVLLPLWKDRRGVVTRAGEDAAERQVSAGQRDLRQAMSDAIANSAAAYWRYVAAVRRLSVQVAAEQRAQRMVDETIALVRADERAPADVVQLRANAASKRATRIAAEQSVFDTWRQLAATIGLDGTAARPQAPATDFPDAATSAPLSVSVDSLVALAQRTRDDRAASALREVAARRLWTAAEHNLAPRLDLSVGLGYTGAGRGWGVDHYFAPLGRNASGVNTTFQLRYQLPIANSAARGTAVGQRAIVDEQRILTDDIARRIGVGVATAADGLVFGALALRAAREAVGLSGESVDNQKAKFQLGAATLIDVLLAEDALTTAQLAEISGQLSYATALASLRHETGMLLLPGGDTPTPDPRALLRTP